MKQFYKKILIISTILLTVLKINAQSIPELLYYKFDGLGTSVTNMASAPPIGTNTATILGGITQGNTGKCDGALIGSGISAATDYLNTGWATNLTGTSWTISFWSSNITPSATLFYIFGDVNASSFRCFTNGVAGANNWILRGGFTDVLISGGATVAPHMNTFVYDMALGNIKAYLDGNLVNTVAQAGPIINGAGPFKVMGYNTNVGAPTGGLLDDFRIYSHALNAGEVMNLYTAVSASATLTN
ncbi:MAG TPA: LamG domain-containing protein, partial [Burkholderiales bacterium]|nr:LamG domain-containing protein [Burkholderiales bacterium]